MGRNAVVPAVLLAFLICLCAMTCHADGTRIITGITPSGIDFDGRYVAWVEQPTHMLKIYDLWKDASQDISGGTGIASPTVSSGVLTWAEPDVYPGAWHSAVSEIASGDRFFAGPLIGYQDRAGNDGLRVAYVADGLYLYDLAVDSDGDGIPNWKERPLPDPDPARTKIGAGGLASYSSLALSGRWVAWNDYSGPTSVIYVYDRALSQAFPFLTTTLSSGPSLSGDEIVWSDVSSGNSDVYAYDLAFDSDSDGLPNWREDPRPDPDPALRNLSADPATQRDPTIGGNLVLWTDERYGGTDIMFYDLADSALTELTHDGYPQWAIHVANGVAAWTDGRSSSTYDVYVWGDPAVWASLFGTVLDAHTGLAIPGATVTDGEIVRTTLADGVYNMPVVPSGAQTVEATATGYVTSSLDIILDPGEQRTLDLPLVPIAYGGITGAITDSASSLPVAGATVACGAATATSGPDGRYVLAVTPGAGLTVTVTAAGYQPRSVSGVSATVSSLVTLDIAVDPLPKGTITGVVKAEDTLAPVSGATVTCGAVTATTAADGTYSLANIYEGTEHSVTATASGFYPATQTGVSVTGGQTTVVDILLPPIVGSIAGTVTGTTTELPISGATVACGSTTATTDARGRYELSEVRIGGGYTVTASASGHALGSASGISVAEKATTKVDFALSPTAFGSIGGKVTDAANGAAIQRATVSCGALSATTATDGSYAITGVPVGEGYRVGASAGGYGWGTATGISVVTGLTATQNFALTQLPFTPGAEFQEILPGSIPSAVGAGWSDYDGDGYPDLLIAATNQGTPIPAAHGPILYHNNHDLTFTDVSQSLQLPSDIAIEQDAVGWADYDNDGNLDVMVASGGRFPYLYHRDATQFVEVGQAAGFNNGGPSRHIAWCDYDGDNLLDVFVPINGQASYLYHNDGDGTFTDVHEAAGIVTGITGDPSGYGGQSASWGDYDNDGRPDLLIARVRGPAMLYHNDGDGTFTDVSTSAGVTVAVDGFSAVWGDYDNDGWLDCYVSSGVYLEPLARRDWLFHNNHDGTFTEVGATAGMAADTAVGFAATWADYDNDGWLDLYVGTWNVTGEDPPPLYHNNGDGTFTNVVVGSGLEDHYQHEAAAWADIDVDGRLDLIQADANYTTRLFQNITTPASWLRVKAVTNAVGDATDTGQPARDAIGARVEVNVDNDPNFPAGRTLTRLIGCNSAHGAQDELVAQFGIPAAGPVAVRVRFPDGTVVIHYGIEVNQTLLVEDVAAALDEDEFTDAGYDNWAYAEIEACVAAGIVKGSGGSYFPTNPVTRDQLAVYIARAMNGGDPTGSDTLPFVDITNPWANVYIAYCIDHGVVKGFDATHYGPTLQVDRGSMAVFVARAEGWVSINDPMDTAPELFADVPAGYWAGTAVKACVDHGVVNGYDATHYQPTWIVSRDQMAVFVTRAFQLPT